MDSGDDSGEGGAEGACREGRGSGGGAGGLWVGGVWGGEAEGCADTRVREHRKTGEREKELFRAKASHSWRQREQSRLASVLASAHSSAGAALPNEPQVPPRSHEGVIITFSSS